MSHEVAHEVTHDVNNQVRSEKFIILCNFLKIIFKVSNHIEEIEEVFNIYDEGVYYDEVETEYEESPFPQQVKVYLYMAL